MVPVEVSAVSVNKLPPEVVYPYVDRPIVARLRYLLPLVLDP